jgi:CMP-N-acetylneuraminic acid synthetase
VLHALDWHRDATGSDPATVMVLQPTSPFRRGETLRRGVQILEADAESDAVVAVSRLTVSSRHVFTYGDGYFLRRLTTDDNRCPVCCPNGSLYVIRTSVLRRVRDLYPNRVRPLETDPIEAIDIDTEVDWFLAEALARAAASFPEFAVATEELGQSGVAR